ncbi:bifunctional UDP-sugar hydrolase/5'-nucleotidase [Sporosarcina sp. Te-1]|uniref:bifunctional metallophosphatase/5'-nucleotidase n=1 Tax=Sporosarcina sp. Te-1 TaxID=2818390 RepID=UPI001A9E2B0A|nr:bifunctional UDP-sugar hydrolase/5'-nucleotidase [Sporosarcina sp. Te-1]QTD42717.1 bifunctional metallophosphatase/5'-nucleotidase [Sporosarcina sp. Te-1]
MKKDIVSLHIYHTNDLHSHFDNWPKISRYVTGEKERHKAFGEACFVFDIGDHIDRSHPYTEGTRGKGNVALLNSAGYDAVTIGNNEGITLSKNALNTLYEGAAFDVILCNLEEPDGTFPKWVKPYRIYETTDGLRVGVVGATAMYPPFYSRLGWAITEPHAALKKVVAEIQEQTDILICLSHLGVHEDRKLAVEIEEIDVILGAHTHHLFTEGEWVGDTLLAATGKFGMYVGHVRLEYDMAKKRILQKEASVVRCDLLDSGPKDIDMANELMDRGKKTLDEKVFYNIETMPQDLFGPSQLASFFGEALIAYTEADCALFNAGIFLSGLQKGWVTKGDLHALLPHPINPCVVMLNGGELRALYELSLNEQLPGTEVRGLGFRGSLMGAMIHQRLRMEDETVLIGNEKVKEDMIYRLVTLDMFTFGYFFPLLKDAPKEYIMPELIRDVVAWYGKHLLDETETGDIQME